MAVAEYVIGGIDHFASRRDIAPDKRDESHFEDDGDKERVLCGDWIDGIEMTYVCCFVFVEKDLFERDGYSKEGWKGILELISIFPTFFAFIVCSDVIALSGHSDCLFEHLVKYIAIFDSNGCCSLYECKDNLKRSEFSLIHKIYKFEC